MLTDVVFTEQTQYFCIGTFILRYRPLLIFETRVLPLNTHADVR